MFISILLLIAAILAGVIIHFTYENHFIITIIAIVALVSSLTTGVCYVINHCQYNFWVKKFEIQKEIIAQTNFNEYTIVEIVDANKELAQYQALYTTFGNLSPIPKEVMNIEPIKIGN